MFTCMFFYRAYYSSTIHALKENISRQINHVVQSLRLHAREIDAIAVSRCLIVFLSHPELPIVSLKCSQ